MKYILLIISGLVLMSCNYGTKPLNAFTLNQTSSPGEDSSALVHGRRCQNEFNFTYGTEAFSNCVLQLSLAREQAIKANNNNLLNNLQNQLNQQGSWQTPVIPNNVPSTPTIRGMLYDQSIFNNTKTCYYNAGGKISTLQVFGNQNCPLTN